MNRKFYKLLVLMAFLGTSQLFAQSNNDTLSEKIDELKDRLNGIEERVMVNESDLSKLNKIKFSGYMQAQYENYSNKLTYPDNSIFLRRARLKTTYQAADGVNFVLQSDFLPSGFSLKDAYVQLNDRWTKTLSLTVGLFNRPNYEVEYSSSQREVPERSRVIRALYPGERALGAKIEYTPLNIPVKVQLALLNGNDYLSFTGTANNVNKDYDNFKDLMARATYSIKLGNFGGLDLGAHTYMGSVRAVVDTTINSKYEVEKTYALGDPIKRSWVGAEFQLFMDILGGMSIKGEYLTGKNAMPGYTSKTTTVSQGSPALSGDSLTLFTTTTNSTTFQPNYQNKFQGYYIYLLKNIGNKHQFALRYDFYDPNTDLSGDEVGKTKYDKSFSNSTTNTLISQQGNQTVIYKNKVVNSMTEKLSSGKSDLAYSTLTFAWQYYFNDFIRITLAYEMPMNEKTANIAPDKATINGVEKMNEYNKVFSQNTLTLRFQAKF
ncbi:MAG: hypothetical protein AB9842_02570 [Bacteroidales bacterium]